MSEEEKPISIEVIPVKVPVDALGDPNKILKAIEGDPIAGPQLDAFTKRCYEYHNQVYAECVKDLDEENKKWFDVWWNGGKISDYMTWEEFWTKYEKAYNMTMWACGQGCG